MKALPGFRDFYPADCARRNFIFTRWRETAARFGFMEYDGPPLEPLELYTEKSGDEIVRQLYNFLDKGERAVAMRPEMTPTFARMAAAKHRDYRKPIKWFAVPQLFRYERQQKGRLREHYQLNADMVGSPSDPLEEAEIITLLASILKACGLTSRNFRIRLSSRQLWKEILSSLDVAEALHGAVFVAVDKIERMPLEETRAHLAKAAINPEQVDAILRATECRSLEELRTAGLLKTGMDAGADAFHLLMEQHLPALGAADCVALDLRIVRGLAYYTGTVFEAFALDEKGSCTGRAIAGGGRYDDLLKKVAGVDLPAVGFGMGDVVLGDLLEEKGLYPKENRPRFVYVTVPSEALLKPALMLTARLREADIPAEFHSKAQTLGKQLEMAEALGATLALLPQADSSVEIKHLADRKQEKVAADDLIELLRRTL